jgi:hypothetical protein
MNQADKDVKTISAFVGKILVSLVTEKSISIGFKDAPVMTAFGRVERSDYKRIIKAIAREPGVAEFLVAAMAEQEGDDAKDATP